MKKKATSDAISTLIGKGTHVEGTITFEDAIRIDGSVNGRITSEKGTVVIGEPAVIKAQLTVGTAIVRGEIEGALEASEKIEIYAPAKISGDITAPVVSIDAGVVFNGNCKMERQFGPSDPKKRDVGIKPPQKD